MANRIKGITVEIGGDTTGLSKALSGVNKEIKSTQSQLKDVEKLLKLDPKNTELLEQKQSLLNQSVEETKKKLDALKEAEQQVQEQFQRGEVSQEQYDALQREIIATENELKNLEREASQSNATLAKIGAVAEDVSTKSGKFADATRGVSTAAGGALVAIGGMAYKAASAADDLNTLAKQTGLSTDTLQSAQYAADRVDVSFETFTGSIAKMTGKLRTNEEGFTALGIATRDANGNLLSSEEIFFNAADALSHISNETERDIAAQELFGKSAADLSGILDDGGAAFREYGDQAREMGLILDEETLNSLNAVNDEIDSIKADALASFAKAGAEALEALSPVLDDVADAISKVLEWIGNLDSGQIKFILSVLAIVAAISPIAGIVSKISGAVAAFTPILSVVGGALKGVFSIIAANPIILVITAIVAAVALLIANWDKVKAKAEELWNKVKTVFDNMKTKIGDTISSIKSFFGGLKLELPHIKLPHFSLTGKLSLSPPSVPHLSVSWYKKAMDNAMLLNSPTIFGASGGKLLGAGEAGTEVVSGANTLMNMIRNAVSENGGNGALLSELQKLNGNILNMAIVLDDGTVVGKLTEGFNASLGAAYISDSKRSLA